jgi:hypothetical protein
MEDFFAATIVVQNYSSIQKAEKLILDHFEFVKRRPQKHGETNKRPDTFLFDDVRLFIKLPVDETTPPAEWEDVEFELQIKTYLQHAWSIATHDLIYKGDSVSWSSSRIAYQVKAMLEHAEVSISEADKLSEANAILPRSEEYLKKNAILKFIRDKWDDDSLPDDLVRLTENVYELVRRTKITIEELIELCNSSDFVGNEPSQNLSPYTSIFLSLFNAEAKKVYDGLKNNRKNPHVFLPDEALDFIPTDEMTRINKIRLQPV